MTRWLITGGCGFIGTSIIRRLISENQDCDIRVLDNLSVGTAAELDAASGGRAALVEGDIRNAETVTSAALGRDVIVHLAANTGVDPSVKDPRLDCETNVIGTLNVLEGARTEGVRRVVFASSGAPVGEVDPPIHEELAPHPVSPYGASKLAGEGYCSAYFRTFGLETVALRFGNVYGPGSGHKNSVVAKFIRLALEGQPLMVFGDGAQTRDFLYIDDLVSAVLKAAETAKIGGEVFQIATNAETSVGELLDLLLPALEAAGVPAPVVTTTERRQGDVLRNFSDTSKAARLLDWRAKTALPHGLARTIEWFLSQGGGNHA